MLRRTLLSLCLIPLLANGAPSAAITPADAALDSAVATHLGAGFSGVVLVRSNPAAAPLIRVYGLANAEKNAPVTPDTPFQIGSITKWLTSVAVLRLVDQGKLALDAPVGKYVADLPPQTAAITVRQLLSNSAGIPNGVRQAFQQDKTIADLRLSHADAARRFAAGPLLFAPGTGWEYSPTTWIVVGAIVERASGMTFADALKDLVLAPAKAGATAVPLQPFKDLPGAALAYKEGAVAKDGTAAPRELNMTPHITFVAASGTVYSTAADLARIAHMVYETAFLSASARAELSRVMVQQEQYALGGRVKSLALGGRARTIAWETGASAGYKSVLAHVPGESKTVVILNNTNMDQGTLRAAGEALLASLY